MLRMLIADDEVIERTVLKKRLQKYYGEDCAILTAENGREVLELYAAYHPQILILDIEMPGINGLEAARTIRKTDRDCSIIFLTAYDEFSYAKMAITVHALDYLLKPCDERELVRVVDEAIRLSGSERSGSERSGYEGSGSQRSEYEGSGSQRSGSEGSEAEYSGSERSRYERNGAECSVSGRQPGQDAEALAQGMAQGMTVFAGDKSEDHRSESERQVEILSYIARHYMEDIALQDIAGYLGYSEAYFCKRFKQHFGHNFVSFLTDFRLKKAEELIRTTGLSIKEIGKAVGYPDPNYFTKVFRRFRGVSPSQFRESGTTGHSSFRESGTASLQEENPV